MPAVLLVKQKLGHVPRKLSRSAGFIPALALIVPAALAFALVHDDARERLQRAPRVVAPTVVAQSAPLAPDTVSLAELPDDNEVDALASSVARRYRVSALAMRDVVDAAYDEARRNRLDPLLILAIIAVESRFNPIAQSEMGAMGLMQIVPRYHADKLAADDVASVLDPETNIRVGAHVLKDCIARGGNEVAGLQLYNGSPDDASNAYAHKVRAERQRLQASLRRAGVSAPRGPVA